MNRPKDLNSPSSWNMRIWDETKHQWLCDGEDDVLPYYGFDIRGGEVTAMQSMDWVYRQFEHGRKLIWERSTGLTDKNGKEIYEGDIVKRTKPHEFLKNVEETETFRIRWGVRKAGFFAYSKERKKHNIPAKRLNANDVYEVIGNVHENPELLEAKC